MTLFYLKQEETVHLLGTNLSGGLIHILWAELMTSVIGTWIYVTLLMNCTLYSTFPWKLKTCDVI